MAIRKPLFVAAGGVLLLAAATAWGLGVSVLASKPDVRRSELPAGAAGREYGRSETVVSTAWGSGPGQLGFNPEGAGLGPQSVAVDDRDRVYVLDPVNRRIVRYVNGAADAQFALPDDTFEDIAVARDHLAALARSDDRRVVLFQTETAVSTTMEISSRVPEVYRIFITGGDVVVECPAQTGRTYHVIGSLDGKTASAAKQAEPLPGDTPLPTGDTLSAALLGRNDIAVDVQDQDHVAKARMRAHSERPVAAIVDATADLKGNVYVTWAIEGVADAAGDARGGRLVVARYSPQGELTGRIETEDSYEPEPFRKVVVSESGSIYQLAPQDAGCSVIRWTPEP